MAYNTKKLKRDAEGIPVPQFFDPTIDDYVPLEGAYGGGYYHVTGSLVFATKEGNSSESWHLPKQAIGFAIVNDGTEDIFFTINSIRIRVKPGETFEDRFPPFNTVAIEGNSAYRALVRE